MPASAGQLPPSMAMTTICVQALLVSGPSLCLGPSTWSNAQGIIAGYAMAVATIRDRYVTHHVSPAGSSLCPRCQQRLCSAQLPARISSSSCWRSGRGSLAIAAEPFQGTGSIAIAAKPSKAQALCHCSNAHQGRGSPVISAKPIPKAQASLPSQQRPCVSACGDCSLALHCRRQPLPVLQVQAQAPPLQWQLRWPWPAQPSTPAVVAVGRHQ